MSTSILTTAARGNDSDGRHRPEREGHVGPPAPPAETLDRNLRAFLAEILGSAAALETLAQGMGPVEEDAVAGRAR